MDRKYETEIKWGKERKREPPCKPGKRNKTMNQGENNDIKSRRKKEWRSLWENRRISKGEKRNKYQLKKFDSLCSRKYDDKIDTENILK